MARESTKIFIAPTRKFIYYGTLISTIFVMALGVWWLYLVFKLATRLESLNIPELSGNLVYMIQWEGLTFFVLLFLIAITHVWLFIGDQRKTRAVTDFFASMGHELKTPLTSVRLQSQIIQDMIQNQQTNPEDLSPFLNRLQEDTVKLEEQIEKSFQLARVTTSGKLSISRIDLVEIISKILSSYPDLKPRVSYRDEHHFIQADMGAIETILKNLLENTLRHNQTESKIDINFTTKGSYLEMSYCDHGTFTGDIKSLGKLFYKHNSPKGSGVGLYLIHKLTKKMGGLFSVTADEKLALIFKLSFKKA